MDVSHHHQLHLAAVTIQASWGSISLMLSELQEWRSPRLRHTRALGPHDEEAVIRCMKPYLHQPHTNTKNAGTHEGSCTLTGVRRGFFLRYGEAEYTTEMLLGR